MKNPFRMPTSAEQAVKELEMAKLCLLNAEAAKEESTALVAMYQERIKRLEARTAKAAANPTSEDWGMFSD